MTMHASLKKIRQGFGLAMCASILMVATSCDSLQQTGREDLDSAVASSTATTVVDKLELTGTEAQKVQSIMSGYSEDEPGSLWFVAAELNETLTDAQKEAYLEAVKSEREERFANARQSRSERIRGKRGERASLNLSDEQKAQLDALRSEMREEMDALREERKNGTLSEDEMRERLKANREKMAESMKTVLTDEQFAELESRRGNARGENRVRGSRNDFQQRSEMRESVKSAMIEALGLSSEQQEQLEQHRSEQREAFEAVREEMREQREAGDLDRDAVRGAMKERMEETREAYRGIFTEEQQDIIALHRALQAEQHQAERGEEGAPKRLRRRMGRMR